MTEAGKAEEAEETEEIEEGHVAVYFLGAATEAAAVLVVVAALAKSRLLRGTNLLTDSPAINFIIMNIIPIITL